MVQSLTVTMAMLAFSFQAPLFATTTGLFPSRRPFLAYFTSPSSNCSVRRRAWISQAAGLIEKNVATNNLHRNRGLRGSRCVSRMLTMNPYIALSRAPAHPFSLTGNSGPEHFKQPYIFAELYVDWAEKWGFDGAARKCGIPVR